MGFTADRLLLFGATGDLSQRMLLPSLCALHADDLLAPELKIVGTARSELSTSEFRRNMYCTKTTPIPSTQSLHCGMI